MLKTNISFNIVNVIELQTNDFSLPYQTDDCIKKGKRIRSRQSRRYRPPKYIRVSVESKAIQSEPYVTVLSTGIIAFQKSLEQTKHNDLADTHENYRGTLLVFRLKVRLLCSSTSRGEGAPPIRSDTRGVRGPLLCEWPRRCRRRPRDRGGTTGTS